jgi:hypothetical protein
MFRINDGEIIKYTGVYYLPEPNNSIPLEIETTFIGKIECERYSHTNGISGIYINPLYILYDDQSSPGNKKCKSNPENAGLYRDERRCSGILHRNDEGVSQDECEVKWHKIINYKLPNKKYFYYPHLLMLPETYYHFQPLYFFQTIESISLDEFTKNMPDIGEMELHYIYY